MGLTDWFDDIEAVRKKDKVHYTFLTTGVFEIFQSPKAELFGLLSPPCRRLDIKSVEVFERGPIFKRYAIKAIGKAGVK